MLQLRDHARSLLLAKDGEVVYQESGDGPPAVILVKK
jgi:hypothetical protein